MTMAISIFLAGVLMASIGQVLMKKGALARSQVSVFRSFLDLRIVAGYGLMLASTVTSTIALKSIPLHFTVCLLPLGYVVVVLMSVAILHERMTRRHAWGLVLIVLGVVVFNVGAA